MYIGRELNSAPRTHRATGGPTVRSLMISMINEREDARPVRPLNALSTLRDGKFERLGDATGTRTGTSHQL